MLYPITIIISNKFDGKEFTPTILDRDVPKQVSSCKSRETYEKNHTDVRNLNKKSASDHHYILMSNNNSCERFSDNFHEEDMSERDIDELTPVPMEMTGRESRKRLSLDDSYF
jgi:hypothetical protein